MARAVAAMTIIPVLLLATTALLAGVQSEVRPAAGTTQGWYSSVQAERGKTAYHERCAACHGRDFVPDDFATGLKGPAFEWRWKGRTVYDLVQVVRTTMPPGEVGTLGPRATRDIVAYLLQVNGYPSGPRELPDTPEALKRMPLARAAGSGSR